MLLLRPNTAVSVDRLTEALWDDEPPLHSRTVLQGHVSRLRALLAEHDAQAYGIELATQGPAYVLRLPETLIDAHRFEELVTLARGPRKPDDAVLMLREALALWQGPRPHRHRREPAPARRLPRPRRAQDRGRGSPGRRLRGAR